VRTMLERLGCRVDVAANGVEAIHYFERSEYDLILMGWQMPLMDGFEATARIRARPNGQVTPIVGTTAARDRAECLAAGMNDRMPKPFQLDGLRALLAKWTLWEDRPKTPKD
jgi:CheY-like chemotaxis protein